MTRPGRRRHRVPPLRKDLQIGHHRSEGHSVVALFSGDDPGHRAAVLVGGEELNIGGSVHDPTDPVGRLLYNVLGMIAEFESDLIRMRTREGMKVAKAKGRLRGKQPKLKPAQEAHLVELWRAGNHTSADLAELFSVARSTVYRAVQRAGEPNPAPPPARPRR
jgi:hypothetical protein